MANEPSGGTENILAYKIVSEETDDNHAGKAEIVTAVIQSLANVTSTHLLCMTNGDELHFTQFVQTNGPALVYLYEDPVFTDTGTRLTQSNLNRNFTTSSNAIFYSSPSIGAISSASLLWESLIVGTTGGSAKADFTGGSVSRPEFHWIFNKNKNYLLKIINTAATSIQIFAQGEYCVHD